MIHSSIDRLLGCCLFTPALPLAIVVTTLRSFLAHAVNKAPCVLHAMQAGLNPQEEAHRDGSGVAVGEDHENDTSHSLPGGTAAPGNDGATTNDRKKAQESHAGFADAVDELDDIVTGMNTFVDDSSAGLDGAEVETVGGPVQFDVDKFMSLLNGEDLM